jgi:hypothetical protein
MDLDSLLAGCLSNDNQVGGRGGGAPQRRAAARLAQLRRWLGQQRSRFAESAGPHATGGLSSTHAGQEAGRRCHQGRVAAGADCAGADPAHPDVPEPGGPAAGGGAAAQAHHAPLAAAVAGGAVRRRACRASPGAQPPHPPAKCPPASCQHHHTERGAPHPAPSPCAPPPPTPPACRPAAAGARRHQGGAAAGHRGRGLPPREASRVGRGVRGGQAHRARRPVA